MTQSHVDRTRIEKIALDNGFDLSRGEDGNWLGFGTSQSGLRIWVSPADGGGFALAVSRAGVLAASSETGSPYAGDLPSGGVAARTVGDLPSLHTLVRRTFQLGRALPDEPLRAFQERTASLPRRTEAERLVVQRVGQDIFRDRLLDYWEGRCAITGLAVPELLRASHIKPWADCESDAERLDVFNGVLLAPNLDAAFDRGFITVAQDGTVLVAGALATGDRALLGLATPLRVEGLTEAHSKYLPWHRQHLFKGLG